MPRSGTTLTEQSIASHPKYTVLANWVITQGYTPPAQGYAAPD